MAESVLVAIADTSALIAFFNKDDQHHQPVRQGMAQAGHLVVSPCVLTELDYLIATRQGPSAASAVIGHVAGRVAAGRWEVPDIGSLLLAAHAVLADYPVIGLAGAMNVVLAREFRTDVIATLDYRHFRMIRPLTPHGAFRLLPDDIST
ncbi:MAG TPA: PIN domain-containing protein [Streptosporangiaceae bacterium]|nr:PIN domain-containing protein [Streptosporangiaceae bacterium]